MGRVTSDRSGNERHTGEWNSDGTGSSVGNGRGEELDVAEAEVDHGGVNAGAPAITPATASLSREKRHTSRRGSRRTAC